MYAINYVAQGVLVMLITRILVLSLIISPAFAFQKNIPHEYPEQTHFTKTGYFDGGNTINRSFYHNPANMQHLVIGF